MNVEHPGVTRPSDEIHPEELSELVERLHRQQERLSIGDVAETLGVSTESVEATLRSMRGEGTPPVQVSESRPASRRFRPRMGLVLLGAILIGGTLFSIGHRAGRGSRALGMQGATEVLASTPSNEDIGAELRAALPAGVTLKIGMVSYTGSPGSVYESESGLVALIEEAIRREARDAPWKVEEGLQITDEALQTFEGGRGAWPRGLAMRTTEILRGKSLYKGNFPYRNESIAPDPSVDRTLQAMRHREAILLANRISEIPPAHGTSAEPD